MESDFLENNGHIASLPFIFPLADLDLGNKYVGDRVTLFFTTNGPMLCWSLKFEVLLLLTKRNKYVVIISALD